MQSDQILHILKDRIISAISKPLFEKIDFDLRYSPAYLKAKKQTLKIYDFNSQILQTEINCKSQAFYIELLYFFIIYSKI